MPEGMPEFPAPFGKKPQRGKKQEDEGSFEVPKRSMGFMKKEPKYKETRKIDIKETAISFGKSLGLLAGVETVAAWGGGPVEAIAVGGFIGTALKPHVVYKKKMSEVI
jgi:hypothetical protein